MDKAKTRVRQLASLMAVSFEIQKDKISSEKLKVIIEHCDLFYEKIQAKTTWEDESNKEYQLNTILEMKKIFVDELKKRGDTQTPEETATN